LIPQAALVRTGMRILIALTAMAIGSSGTARGNGSGAATPSWPALTSSPPPLPVTLR